MKGKIRIGGALVVGIVIILGSLYVNKNMPVQSTEEATGQVIAIGKPELRERIDTKDSDGDGIADWQESLNEKVFRSITAPSSTNPFGSTDTTYTPPTTFTGKFSEAFLADYLEGKMEGEDFSDPTNFVNAAVQSIESSTRSKKHSRAEINIIPTTSESAHAYGNELVLVMNKHSNSKENEILILQEAIKKDDAGMLKKLEPIQTSYANIIADSLTMPVPDIFAAQHTELLNAYEAIYADIVAMQYAFSDPLLAVARISTYYADVENLSSKLREIARVIDSQNITYTNAEAGSFFYIFDAI